MKDVAKTGLKHNQPHKQTQECKIYKVFFHFHWCISITCIRNLAARLHGFIACRLIMLLPRLLKYKKSGMLIKELENSRAVLWSWEEALFMPWRQPSTPRPGIASRCCMKMLDIPWPIRCHQGKCIVKGSITRVVSAPLRVKPASAGKATFNKVGSRWVEESHQRV